MIFDIIPYILTTTVKTKFYKNKPKKLHVMIL